VKADKSKITYPWLKSDDPLELGSSMCSKNSDEKANKNIDIIKAAIILSVALIIARMTPNLISRRAILYLTDLNLSKVMSSAATDRTVAIDSSGSRIESFKDAARTNF